MIPCSVVLPPPCGMVWFGGWVYLQFLPSHPCGVVWFAVWVFLGCLA